MKGTNTVLVLGVLVVLAVGVFPLLGTSIGMPSTTAISAGNTAPPNPGDTVTGQSEDTVTVTVWANVTGVRGYQANVTFDPAVAQLKSVSGGADFDDPVTNANNDAGWVAFNQLRSSETSDPVLAVLTFTLTGEAGDVTGVSFVEADTKFATGDGETFTPESYDDVELTVEGSTATPEPTETPTAAPTESVAAAIDENEDGRIGDTEILTAIELWRTDEAVPDTGGKTIGDTKMLELIEMWRNDTPV